MCNDPSGARRYVRMPERVLLVDDDLAVLRVVERALVRASMSVAAASSGEDALKLLTRDRFDAALIDKNLQGIDGVEVIRHARIRQPHCACILMTGLPSLPSAIEALRLGALDYVQKPSPEFDVIADRVRAAVGTAREVATAHHVAALRKELETKEQLLSRQTVEIAVAGELSDLKEEEEALVRAERALRDRRLLESAQALLDRARAANSAESLIPEIEAHLALIGGPPLS